MVARLLWIAKKGGTGHAVKPILVCTFRMFDTLLDTDFIKLAYRIFELRLDLRNVISGVNNSISAYASLQTGEVLQANPKMSRHREEIWDDYCDS